MGLGPVPKSIRLILGEILRRSEGRNGDRNWLELGWGNLASVNQSVMDFRSGIYTTNYILFGFIQPFVIKENIWSQKLNLLYILSYKCPPILKVTNNQQNMGQLCTHGQFVLFLRESQMIFS